MRHTIWAKVHNRPQSLISIDGVVMTGKHRVMRRGVNQTIPPRIHKTHINKATGYEALRLDGKTQTVHRILMLSFNGSDIDEQVNHRDGVKTNNKYENLEWLNNVENKKHAEDTGLTHKRVIGDADVRYIRSCKGMGITNVELSHTYECSATAISNIKAFKTYKDIV